MKPTFTIGVTGHRVLNNESQINELVLKIIHKLSNTYCLGNLSDFSFKVLTPLAEGADRIVANQILKLPNSNIKVVLPFNKKEYKKDFISKSSRLEFESLLAKAKEVITLNANKISNNEQRNIAYLNCGKYNVDNCDLLIAIWNGNPASGVGGTGDIVQYAREVKRELIIINPENLDVISEGEYKDYCSELNKTVIKGAILEKHYNELFSSESNNINDSLTRLSLQYKEVIIKKMLPDYVKSDRLSIKSQSIFRKSMMIFWFTFIALFLISAGISFGNREIPSYLIILELVVLILAFIDYYFTKNRSHPGWIENRMMAEYIRIFMFTSIFPSDAIVNLIRMRRKYIWANRIILMLLIKITPIKFKNSSLANIKEFLGKWLSSQIEYHSANKIRHYIKDERWNKISIICFCLAFIVVIIHLTVQTSSIIESTLIFLTFVLPAFVSTIAALRYVRNDKAYSFNSEIMFSIIEEYQNKLDKCMTIKEIGKIVEELGFIFINELERWYITAKSHELELAL